MRRSVYERDVQGRFGKLQLREITGEDVRAMASVIVSCGVPPATAVHAREITLVVFRYAIERGQKMLYPAQEAASSTIATVEPKGRALSQEEIGQFYKYLEQAGICLSEPLWALWVSPPHERCYSEPGHDLQLGICPEGPTAARKV